MIPVLKPSCSDAEIAAVTDVLRSGWWGLGPKCAEFERKMQELTGYKHCITVNSATAALHLALIGLHIGPGDEVIVPSLTFISTALAVSYVGATPIFADVYHDTLTIDWESVKRLTNRKTAAVIAVDFAGHPAGRSGCCPIVEDAAHACLGQHYGDTVCYSFHPVKNLGTGDGGAVLLNDDAQAERLTALRWCGIDKSTWQRTGKRYSWDYAISEVGYKFHWNDIQAAIGLAQLARYDDMQARRKQIAQRYLHELKYAGDIELPADHPFHTWHLFAIRVPAEKRDELLDFLAARGISCGVHYKPLTDYPMYSAQPTPTITDREWRRLISLPVYADMTEDDQTDVIRAVTEYMCA